MPRRSRSRSRKRSRSKSKTATGLPLASKLKTKDKGKLGRDYNKNIKIVKKTGKKLTWKALTPKDAKEVLKPLTRKREDHYFDKIDNNLDDEDTIRDILVKVLKEVQPPKSQFVN